MWAEKKNEAKEGDDEIPDTPESATTWMCRACKHDFSLTARAFDIEERRVSRKRDRGFGPLTCPKCQKIDAWRANRCPIHHRMFFVADVPGSDGLCPDCKAKRKAPSPQK